jgi:polar amino acid transport system substrate-binding protein
MRPTAPDRIGRIDNLFRPERLGRYGSGQQGATRLVGLVPIGWPRTADVTVITRNNAGLAQAITCALNAQIENGSYGTALAH